MVIEVGQETAVNGAGRVKDSGGQENHTSDLAGKDFGGHSRVAHQKTARPPTKNVEVKKGWIEFPKKGTNNPKRYAYRRRWLKVDGRWVKSRPVRIKTWGPMSEDDYVKYKQSQERAKRAERRERHRTNQGNA
jgi:hypothetical protein